MAGHYRSCVDIICCHSWATTYPAICINNIPYSWSLMDLDQTDCPLSPNQFACDTSGIYPSESLSYSVVREYDVLGNVTRLTDRTGSTSNGFDNLNRCPYQASSIQHQGSSLDLVNKCGLTLRYAFNNAQQITGLVERLNTTNDTCNYGYDGCGVLASRSTAIGGTIFTTAIFALRQSLCTLSKQHSGRSLIGISPCGLWNRCGTAMGQ